MFTYIFICVLKWAK